MEMKSIAIDLDGVLAEYDGFKGIDVIGKPRPGARLFVQKLKEKAKIIIHTCRVSGIVEGYSNELCVEDRAELVKMWLDKWGIPFDEIWTGKGKPYAVAYVDDRAVVVNRRYEEPIGGNEFAIAFAECERLLEGKEKE